jgi:hypothetical protein
MTQNRQASSALTGALHPRDHTVIRVQPDCRILNLPEETRRKIYRYALTSSSGPLFVRETSIIILLPAYEVEYVDGKLTVRPYTEEEKMVHYYRHPVHGFKLYAGPNDVAEMNQLKYVCRKLYHETRCLTVKTNDIAFVQRDKSDPPAPVQFARWLHHCPKSYKELIRTVVLKAAYVENSPGRGTPQAEVHQAGLHQLGLRQDAPYQGALPQSFEERAANMERMKQRLCAPCHCFNIIANFCTAFPSAVVKYHV